MTPYYKMSSFLKFGLLWYVQAVFISKWKSPSYPLRAASGWRNSRYLQHWCRHGFWCAGWFVALLFQLALKYPWDPKRKQSLPFPYNSTGWTGVPASAWSSLQTFTFSCRSKLQPANARTRRFQACVVENCTGIRSYANPGDHLFLSLLLARAQSVSLVAGGYFQL